MSANEVRDIRIAAQRKVNRGLAAVVMVMILFVIAASGLFIAMRDTVNESNRLAHQNHDILTTRLAEKDAEIAQYKDVQSQAVAAITKLAGQVKSLGGETGIITITPTTLPPGKR